MIEDTREAYTSNKHSNAVLKSHKPYGESDLYEESKSAASRWLGIHSPSLGGVRGGDNADSMSADKLIGGELWVKPGASAITTYSDKSMTPGKAIKTYKAGSYIGIVESFVTNPNMLMTTDKQFIPIEGSNFDSVKMEASLAKNKAAVEKQIADATAKRKAANTSPLYKTGVGIQDAASSALSFVGGLKWYIVAVGLVVLIAVFYRVKG